MANTYTQLYIQIIFAVKGRNSLIKEKNREELQKYVYGIIENNHSKLIAIFCNPDHIHILIGLSPQKSISDLTRIIKSNSSKWINEKNWINGSFKWQEGYAAFSYSKSQLNKVIKHIENQPIHHKKTSFRDEYLSILKKSDIQYDDQFIFDFYNF